MSANRNFIFGAGEMLAAPVPNYLLRLESATAHANCSFAFAALEQAARVARSSVDRAKDVDLARSAFEMIEQLSDRLDVAAQVELRPRIAETFARARTLALGQLEVASNMPSYHDALAEIAIATCLQRLMDAIIVSDLLSLKEREPMSEMLFEFGQTANRLANTISDPSRYEFEWVHEFAVRLAYEAQSIALSATCSYEAACRRLREERSTQ